MLQQAKSPSYVDLDLSLKYKVKDINLAEEGLLDMQLSEKEMPGLMAIREKYGPQKPFKGMKIMGSLHMTIQTAMLIDTLYELGRISDGRPAIFFHPGSCRRSHCPKRVSCRVCLERGNPRGVLVVHGTGFALAGWFRPGPDRG